MRLPTLIIIACATLPLSGCKKNAFQAAAPTFDVPTTGLKVPHLPGWIEDKTVVTKEPDRGGILLRLVREGGVTGSPRIDVLTEPKTSGGTLLRTYFTDNLQQMGNLEDRGVIQITSVRQEAIRVGQIDGFEVRHEYAIGPGAQQVAISQVSRLFVLAGRGITITAAGRTELYHPLASNVEKIITGIELGVPGIQTSVRAMSGDEDAEELTGP